MDKYKTILKKRTDSQMDNERNRMLNNLQHWDKEKKFLENEIKELRKNNKNLSEEQLKLEIESRKTRIAHIKTLRDEDDKKLEEYDNNYDDKLKEEVKKSMEVLKHVRNEGNYGNMLKANSELTKIIDDSEKVEIAETLETIAQQPALTLKRRMKYEKKAHDPDKLNQPEGVEFFNNIFKTEFKKERGTQEDLKKDVLKVVAFKVEPKTMQDHIAKAVETNLSVSRGNQYKIKSFLDHLSERPSLSSSLEKALNKITKK